MGASNQAGSRILPRAGAFGSSDANVVSTATPWERAKLQPGQGFFSQEALSQGFPTQPANPTPATPAYGGGGGGRGCFSAAVEVKTPEGLVAFGELPEIFKVENETGIHEAQLVVHPDYSGEMIVLGDGKLVTLDHLMKDGGNWIPASEKYASLPRVFFSGNVYNMHVISESEQDHNYILFNGDVAHNLKAFVEGDYGYSERSPWWYGY